MQQNMYDWPRLQHLCVRLAGRIQSDHGKIDVIIAIARGGMFPALIVAHELGIRRVFSTLVYTTSQDGPVNERKKPEIIYSIPKQEIFGKTCLILDDVIDTGITMNAAKSMVLKSKPQKLITAAMVWSTAEYDAKLMTEGCQADYFGIQIPVWAAVPWEL